MAQKVSESMEEGALREVTKHSAPPSRAERNP
jgi:hypothetical protein